MKNSINIEYTEDEFKSSIKVAQTLVEGFIRLGSQVLENESRRRERYRFEDQIEKLESKIKKQSSASSKEIEELEESIHRLSEEVHDLGMQKEHDFGTRPHRD